LASAKMMMMVFPSHPNALTEPLLRRDVAGSPMTDSGPAQSYVAPNLGAEAALPVEKLRCKYCCEWYGAAENVQTEEEAQHLCQYHPGHYRTGLSKQDGGLHGWSCCKSESESAPGCKQAALHVEDAEITKAVVEFKAQGQGDSVSAFTEELDRRFKLSQDEALMTPGTPSSAAGADPPQLHLHKVQPSDTIQGLSLQYGVGVDQLKAMNDLPTDSIIQCSQLIIARENSAPKPKAEASPEVTLHKRMRAENAGVTMQEAKAYLGMADGDVEEAHKMWKEDKESEDKQAPAASS